MKHTQHPWKHGPAYEDYIITHNGVMVARVRDVLGNEGLYNSHLITLAPTAPHDCEDPTCPGARNKRRLEAFEAMKNAAKRLINELDNDGGIASIDDLRAALKLAEEASR